MNKERWQLIERIYHAALEREGERRSAFLNEACRGDDELRDDVEGLITHDDQSSSFIELPALAIAAREMADDSLEQQQSQISNGSSAPQHIGPYKLLAPLGKGGMGEVHLALDTRLNRKVAIKLLPAAFTTDSARVRRFEQEARAASALNHPNILTIYEIGQHDSHHFIVTEFIEGETLRQRMTSSHLNLETVLEVGIQIASALGAAHDSGIVHRDIKPENIMLRPDGYVKVLDFGLAKLTEPQAITTDAEAPIIANVSSMPGMVLGTVTYMSPEQARGLEVDARTDIFSLGVVLYELVAGRAPFEGATISDLIVSILERDPLPLIRYWREVPVGLERIIAKALQKNGEERYQTARDLQLELKSLAKETEIAANSEGRRPTESTSGRQTAKKRAEPAVSTAEQGAPHTTSSPDYIKDKEGRDQGITDPLIDLRELKKKLESAGKRKRTAWPRSIILAEFIVDEIKRHKLKAALFVAALITAAAVGYYNFVATKSQTTINSLAVLPFINESGDADVEYLSNGMSESLINSLTQLPNLSVKARSSVFRYKGREVEAQQVASELSVQAILNGRLVLRGDDLSLYLSLVDGRRGNQIWGEQYNRKLTDLLPLQMEIARDVSKKLRARLSGEDAQKLTKNYTANPEAYQLYLNGRDHLLKLTVPEIQTGISYFKQAIEFDPSYALAYVGLADAYRSFALAGQLPSTELFAKAKAAAQRAIDIDDTLAEAHAELGYTIFWQDWDWNTAENQLNRALELNPNNADAHLFYAHLLSNTGRHAEGLVEVKRARELDPLDSRVAGLEVQFLLYAGETDEALARSEKALEIDPTFGFAHMQASTVYIEKKMFAEAIDEARKARELNRADSNSNALLAYALAKSGKQAEARTVLDQLLKLSAEHYIPPYNIALTYNGLGDRLETIAWLERGYKERDRKMVFLKVDPKWINLHDDSRFEDLLRRVGFPK